MKIKKYQDAGVNFIEIINEINFKVTLCDLGAAIYGIYLNNVPMTLTTTDVNDFKKESHYHGKTIGRVSGRIKNGQYVVNGKTYQVSLNEGNNTLHGGHDGLSTKYFDSEIIEENKSVKVIYTYHSPDGESGFNSNMDFKVTYIIDEFENVLEVILEAVSDDDTVCMLTNHAYFSLGDYDNSELTLYINSLEHIVVNETDLIPEGTKKVDEVTDFSKGKLLVKDIEHPSIKLTAMKGYDMEYIYRENTLNMPNVVLENKRYMLELYSDTDGAVIYSDNFENPAKFLTNETDTRRRGIAIEPSDHHLNSHNLKKGEVYKRRFIYSFHYN
jgi:aldose 1-epimerase